MLDLAYEEDHDQLTSTGIQQLLDPKEPKKKVYGISQSAYQPHVELQTKTYNKSHS